MADGLPDYLTTEEVAVLLRTSAGTVRYWRSKGIGPPGAKVGRRWLYLREDVDAWVRSRRVNKKQPPTSK